MASYMSHSLTRSEGVGALRLDPSEDVDFPPVKTYTFVPVTGQILCRFTAVDEPKDKAKTKVKAAKEKEAKEVKGRNEEKDKEIKDAMTDDDRGDQDDGDDGEGDGDDGDEDEGEDDEATDEIAILSRIEEAANLKKRKGGSKKKVSKKPKK
jgi:hypothetical protein